VSPSSYIEIPIILAIEADTSIRIQLLCIKQLQTTIAYISEFGEDVQSVWSANDPSYHEVARQQVGYGKSEQRPFRDFVCLDKAVQIIKEGIHFVKKRILEGSTQMGSI
jgi:hypothetical protein